MRTQKSTRRPLHSRRRPFPAAPASLGCAATTGLRPPRKRTAPVVKTHCAIATGKPLPAGRSGHHGRGGGRRWGSVAPMALGGWRPAETRRLSSLRPAPASQTNRAVSRATAISRKFQWPRPRALPPRRVRTARALPSPPSRPLPSPPLPPLAPCEPVIPRPLRAQVEETARGGGVRALLPRAGEQSGAVTLPPPRRLSLPNRRPSAVTFPAAPARPRPVPCVGPRGRGAANGSSAQLYSSGDVGERGGRKGEGSGGAG